MKRRILLLSKCGLTILIFVILFWRIDFSALEKIKSSINSELLGLALIITLLQSYICMLRWHIILRFVGVVQTINMTMKVFWAGMFFNSFLPTGVAGDILRVWMIKRTGAPISKNLNSVLLDRLLALFALVIAAWVAAPFLKKVMGETISIQIFRLLALGGLLGFVVLFYANKMPKRWHRYRVARLIQHLSLDMRLLFAEPRKFLLIILSAVCALGAQILVVYCLARALALPIELLDCLVFVPPIILIMTLPISIGGWGLREGAFVTFFSIIGISSAASLSLSILFGCAMMLVSVPGGIVWILWHKHRGEMWKSYAT